MKQFDLSLWLKNKSRKVVTRDGREVEILKVNAKGNYPIIGVYPFSDTEDMESSWRIDGRKTENGESLFDLFFADEEDELTDFESDLFTAFSDAWQQYLFGESVNVAKWAKEHSKDLLESARKELQPEFEVELDKAYKTADNVQYQNGKQDALKDLPKWKKATEHKKFGYFLIVLDASLSLCVNTEVFDGDYYIELKDLKTLPKEE